MWKSLIIFESWPLKPVQEEKEKDPTQSYDESPYTKQKTQPKCSITQWLRPDTGR